MIEIPDSSSASVSLGIIISVNANKDLGKSIAGAGLSIVVTPFALAILKACSIASIGTSHCATTKSASVIGCSAAMTSLALKVIFAPPYTKIVF